MFHQSLVLILLLSIKQYSVLSIEFNLSSNHPNYANPDDYGYRYCASWKLVDGTTIHSTCDPYTMNRCGEKMDFDYKCCSGFEKNSYSLGGPSSNPCGKVIPQFNDCPSVIEALGYPNFAAQLRKIPELKRKNGKVYTIFVPIDDKVDNNTVAYYVAKGRHYTDEMKDGTELESTLNGQQLSISRSPYGTLSVECSEISQADTECQSGLIHIINRGLIPRLGFDNLDKSSLLSLLKSDPETREFAGDLPQHIQNQLDDTDSTTTYTVTVPSSTAWRALRRTKTTSEIMQIAQNHVSVGKKCSANIYKSEQFWKTVGGSQVAVECEVQNRKEVRKILNFCGQESAFKKIDQVAGNGVLHVIDKPLLPSSAYTLKDLINNPECAKKLKIDKFIDLLKECNLYMDSSEQYAVIAPENSAFDWWKDYHQFKKEYERFQIDAAYRCRVARYHIIKHQGNLKNMTVFSGHTNGHRSNNKNNYLYETTYFTKNNIGSMLNYHYSPVKGLDSISLDGSSIYRTSRINVIPEQNITDIVGTDPDLSNSKKILVTGDIDKTLLEKNAPKNLLLVTTDEGWLDPRALAKGKKLNNPEFGRYTSTPSNALNFAKLNHVPLYLWGGDIGYFPKNTVHRFRSSADIELIFWVNDKNEMRIGYDDLPVDKWPKVVKFNKHARDGIIWTLDGVLKCPEMLCPLKLEDVDVYTFYTAACMTRYLDEETGDIQADFSSHPTDIALRHPDKCLVIKQGEVTATKDVFEAQP